MEQAMAYPGMPLLELTPRIAIESMKLPGTFHRDPADQLIIATGRVYNIPLIAADSRILQHPHTNTGR
jgi:PIN domain nuclease of toxin-antitoxin system